MPRNLWTGFVISGAVVVALARCGGGASTAPSKSQPQVFVALTGAPFTATVEGRTITADGTFTIPMSPGTHEIFGSFSSGQMIIVFGGASLGGGGVQSGSLVSVEGIAPLVQQCAAGWGDFSRSTRTFRVRFVVTTNGLAACQ
jgi:hypothetical protein